MWVCAESDWDFYESPGPFFKLENKINHYGSVSLVETFCLFKYICFSHSFFNPLPPTYNSLGMNFFCNVISEFHFFFFLGFWKAYSCRTVVSDWQISTVSRLCYGFPFVAWWVVFQRLCGTLMHCNICYRSESYRSVNALNSSWPSYESRSYTEEQVLTIRNANNWLH